MVPPTGASLGAYPLIAWMTATHSDGRELVRIALSDRGDSKTLHNRNSLVQL